MRRIDIETWSRYEHFKVFNTFDYPHFNLCANVDLTKFHTYVKQQGHSINVAIVYVLARAANAVPEFRVRIRLEEVVEHDVVHPSSTILIEPDLFTFCTMEYFEDFPAFAAGAAQAIARVKNHPALDDAERDDLLFMTAIPWVSFTSFVHPIHMHPVDSVPRFAWGKFFDEDQRLKMPLSVQGHHALMDGLHMGRLYEKVQEYLDQPERILGS